MTGGVKGTVKARQAAPALLQLWQAMRVCRRFTLPQLLTTCPLCSTHHAHRYIGRLKAAGYVRVARRRVLGQPGQADVLQLVRDTGPLPPICREASKVVFDQNTRISYDEQGNALLPDATPRRPAGPPTAAQRAVLVCLLRGQPPASALADAANAGALRQVLRGLEQRGLVDTSGALLPEGRTMAEAAAGATP